MFFVTEGNKEAKVTYYSSLQYHLSQLGVAKALK